MRACACCLVLLRACAGLLLECPAAAPEVMLPCSSILAVDPAADAAAAADDEEGTPFVEQFAQRYVLGVVNAVRDATRRSLVPHIAGKWRGVFDPYCNVSTAHCQEVGSFAPPRKTSDDDDDDLRFGYDAPRDQVTCLRRDLCDWYDDEKYLRWRRAGFDASRLVHRPKQKVRKMIDDFSPEGETIGEGWLGVYARAPIHEHQRFVAAGEYRALVEHFLDGGEGRRVLLAADDVDAAVELGVAFDGDHRVHIFGGGGGDTNTQQRPKKKSVRGAFALIALLAKCEFFAYATCAVAEAVFYRNLQLHWRSVNLEYTKAPARLPWGTTTTTTTTTTTRNNRTTTTTYANCTTVHTSSPPRVVVEYDVRACAETHGGGDGRGRFRRFADVKGGQPRPLTLEIRFVNLRPQRKETNRDLGDAERRFVATRGLSVLAKSIDLGVAEHKASRNASATVAVDVDLPTSQEVAAELVDAWLTPRLTWRIVSSSPHFVLRRFGGGNTIVPLLLAVQSIQYPARCDRARVAFAGGGFFGASVKAWAKDFSKNVRYGDAPVVPVLQRRWPFLDESFGCASDRAFTIHRSLACYFLPATSCAAQFDPTPLLLQGDDGYDDIPKRGSGEICGHLSLVVVSEKKNDTSLPSSSSSSSPPSPSSVRTKKARNALLRRGGTRNASWHVECDAAHHDGKSGDEKLLRLLGAAGDASMYRRYRYGPPRSKQRGLFFKESSSSSSGLSATVATGMLHLGMMLFVAFRPNRRTRFVVAERVKSWRAANPTFDGGRCAAVHVRHGDKVTPRWQREKKNDRGFAMVSFDDYVANASSASSLPPPRVLYMTDDKDVVDDAPRVAAKFGVDLFTVPPGRPLVSSRAVARDDKANRVNHQVACSKDVAQQDIAIKDLEAQVAATKKKKKDRQRLETALLEARRERKRAPASCAHDYVRHPETGDLVGSEELLSWLVTWDLMATCDTFVAYSMKDSFFTEFIYVWLCILRFTTHEGQACPRLVLLEKTTTTTT